MPAPDCKCDDLGELVSTVECGTEFYEYGLIQSEDDDLLTHEVGKPICYACIYWNRHQQWIKDQSTCD